MNRISVDLSAKKFASIKYKILRNQIPSVNEIDYIVNLIIKKAMTEPKVCNYLSELCRDLILVTVPSYNTTFRKTLLNQCQRVFETQLNGNHDIKIIHFINELFKKNIITQKIIHSIISSLLEPKIPNNNALNALNELFMGGTGKMLDMDNTARGKMNHYFLKIKDLSEESSLSRQDRRDMKVCIERCKSYNLVPDKSSKKQLDPNEKSCIQNR